MAKTMTVDLGDELLEFIESGDYRTQSEAIRETLRLLREKQAESRLQALRDLLAEGLSSGDSVEWEKMRFSKKSKQVRGQPVKTVKLPPKPVGTWMISGILQVLMKIIFDTPRPEQGEHVLILPVERHIIYFLQTDYDIIVIRVLSQLRCRPPS